MTLQDQPPPIKGDAAGEEVWPILIAKAKELSSLRLVLSEMEERHRIGVERYGTGLRVNNGRDPVVDGLQELLDGAVYFTQQGLREWNTHMADIWFSRAITLVHMCEEVLRERARI